MYWPISSKLKYWFTKQSFYDLLVFFFTCKRDISGSIHMVMDYKGEIFACTITYFMWSGETPWKKTWVLVESTLESTHLAHVLRAVSKATMRSMSLCVRPLYRTKSHLQYYIFLPPKHAQFITILYFLPTWWIQNN